ncbi:hypothetical protein ACWDUN_17055 [Mycobacterium sp. NPDC003323]
MTRLAMMVLPMLGVATLVGTPAAGAAPEDQGCAVNLSAPAVVEMSGMPMVVASVRPGACNRAVPQLQVACLQQVGSQTAPLCVQAEGPGTAEVRLTPYTPGAGYVVTGRVCANIGSPPVTFCNSAGPSTVTL